MHNEKKIALYHGQFLASATTGSRPVCHALTAWVVSKVMQVLRHFRCRRHLRARLATPPPNRNDFSNLIAPQLLGGVMATGGLQSAAFHMPSMVQAIFQILAGVVGGQTVHVVLTTSHEPHLDIFWSQ